MTMDKDSASANRDTEDVREQVRANYAATAITVLNRADQGACCDASACCGPDGTGEDDRFGAALYADDERRQLPVAAVEASLGCGNPLAVADVRPGETVLDLGSGGGIDVLLSARRVGPTGKAYGLDMVPEMVKLARRNAAEAGVTNVEFLQGNMEDIPLPDGSVDVVISNCVVNLSVDKPAVFASIFRVLTPGGRLGLTDVVADDALTRQQRAQRGGWASCIAGALSASEYRRGLLDAGFTDASITYTNPVADGMHSAIVRATKPRT